MNLPVYGISHYVLASRIVHYLPNGCFLWSSLPPSCACKFDFSLQLRTKKKLSSGGFAPKDSHWIICKSGYNCLISMDSFTSPVGSTSCLVLKTQHWPGPSWTKCWVCHFTQCALVLISQFKDWMFFFGNVLTSFPTSYNHFSADIVHRFRAFTNLGCTNTS